MANMSYCRFRNTEINLSDCLSVLDEDHKISDDEKQAGINMFKEFLEFCTDMGIIENYSEEHVNQVFKYIG